MLESFFLRLIANCAEGSSCRGRCKPADKIHIVKGPLIFVLYFIFLFNVMMLLVLNIWTMLKSKIFRLNFINTKIHFCFVGFSLGGEGGGLYFYPYVNYYKISLLERFSIVFEYNETALYFKQIHFLFVTYKFVQDFQHSIDFKWYFRSYSKKFLYDNNINQIPNSELYSSTYKD